MKHPIKYKDEDIGEPLITSDFLPSPEALKLKSERKKVTLSLSKESIDYFKAMADENGLQYQVIIRTLLDDYVSHQKHIDE